MAITVVFKGKAAALLEEHMEDTGLSANEIVVEAIKSFIENSENLEMDSRSDLDDDISVEEDD